MKTILIITGAPFLKAGNQSIRRMVSGLLDRNFKVVLWTIGSNDRPIIHENLTYKCFKTKEKINKRNKPLETHKNICGFIEPNEIVDLSNDFKQWTRGIPALFFYYFKILLYMVSNIKTLRTEIDFIWGYERSGILISKFISKFLIKKPLITSYQGTALESFLKKYGKLGTFLRLPIDYCSTIIRGDLVIMTDDGTKGDKVLRILKNKSNNILFIPNGVDKEELRKVKTIDKSELGLNENDILCVVAVRLEKWKRVDRSILLMEAIKKRGIDKIKLIIIGDGREKICLEALCNIKNLSDYIQFWGWQPYHKTLEVIKTADMLWTFQDHSNLTNSVQDALAFGKTIVTINDGSIDNILSDESSTMMLDLNEFLSEGVSKIETLTCNRFRNSDFFTNNIFEWEDRTKHITDKINML